MTVAESTRSAPTIATSFRSRKRVASGAKAAAAKSKDVNDYEQQRLEKIRKNQEMLLQLQITQQKQTLQTAGVRAATPVAVRRMPKRKRATTDDAPAAPLPTRSYRTRSKAPAVASTDDSQTSSSDLETRDVEEVQQEHSMTCEEYCKAKGLTPGFAVDGVFRGWVAPEICAKYGIAGSATDAWELNGGGTFSFKNPTGAQQPKKGKVRATGQSSVKEWSSKMLHKNPNAFFYRHCQPGEEHWQGDWTDEEHQRFLELARTHGIGSKWGLFASYIPHRVGYQCRQFYVSVVLPSGEILDPNYMMAQNGEAIYVGGSQFAKKKRAEQIRKQKKGDDEEVVKKSTKRARK